MQNVVLALRDAGLGTVLSTMLVTVEADAARLLRVPVEQYGLAAHLTVGYPTRPFPRRLNRRPVEQFSTLDAFDGPSLHV